MPLPVLNIDLEKTCLDCGGECCKDFGLHEGGLVLLPMEFRQYKEEAERRNLTFKHKPIQVIREKKRKKTVVLAYGIQTEPCIFFEEGFGCTIYDNRPLICRSYPLQKVSLPHERPTYNIDACPAREKVAEATQPFLSDLKKMMMFDAVAANETHEAFFQMTFNVLGKLEDEGKVKIREKHLKSEPIIDSDLLLAQLGYPMQSTSKELLDVVKAIFLSR